ncbi:leucine-rich repeat neuronal protein 4 [Ictalurus punctatus]|uniref:Leucine-rich repeat neuronal protein 4 n=1 Tax=Ictalurus punctatus TaxID=7998 RepID=A0A2D0SZL4_ICTPU|nr:leucine-rich repeat neuronal protein 4 [Ictalurus punctatus]
MHNFTLLLLALLVDFLLAVSLNPVSSKPPVTKTRIRYIGVLDDYDEEETPISKVPEQAGATTTQFIPLKCEYDPCVVPKVPCSVVAAQTKCYCPGITGPDELPTAPEIKELKQGASGLVEIHWCAPQSTVSYYKIIIEGSHEQQIFSNSSRTGLVQGVMVGSRVCVLAGNNVGFSAESEISCALFEPHKSNQAPEMSWVIAGGISLLVLALVLAVVLLWRWRRGRKNASMDGEGLRNPSYTTNETL